MVRLARPLALNPWPTDLQNGTGVERVAGRRQICKVVVMLGRRVEPRLGYLMLGYARPWFCRCPPCNGTNGEAHRAAGSVLSICAASRSQRCARSRWASLRSGSATDLASRRQSSARARNLLPVIMDPRQQKRGQPAACRINQQGGFWKFRRGSPPVLDSGRTPDQAG
jgi:hypothetical protein